METIGIPSIAASASSANTPSDRMTDRRTAAPCHIGRLAYWQRPYSGSAIFRLGGCGAPLQPCIIWNQTIRRRRKCVLPMTVQKSDRGCWKLCVTIPAQKTPTRDPARASDYDDTLWTASRMPIRPLARRNALRLRMWGMEEWGRCSRAWQFDRGGGGDGERKRGKR